MSPSESLSFDPATEISALEAFYADTGAYLDDLSDDALWTSVPPVSDWSVGQHLFHIWRANASMLKAVLVLVSGRAETQEPALSKSGRQVLREGTIPRGVGTSPEAMRPPEDLDRDGLRDTWTRSRDKFASVADQAEAVSGAEGGLPHPHWGILTAPQWLRAAHVHADHHAAIVGDILADSSASSS